MTSRAVAGSTELDPVAMLFERHHVEVYSYLRRMVRDTAWAEDLSQETFLRVFGARQQLPLIQNPRAWLYRIATNLALTALRRRRRFAWLPWRDADGCRAEPPGGQAAVEEALAALPPGYRAPLILYAQYGLSTAEVGEALNLTPAAVKTRLFRAREMLRQAYERGDGR